MPLSPYTVTVYANGAIPPINGANLNKNESALSAVTAAVILLESTIVDKLDKSGGTMTGNLELPSLTIGGVGVSPYNFGLKNKLRNANFKINTRAYVSATATTVANQYTLDGWRVITLGENLTFSTTAGVVTITAPLNGVEQIIDAADIEGGSFVLEPNGTATVKVYESIDNITYAEITPSGTGVYTVTGGYYVKVKLSNGTAKNVQFEPGIVKTAFEQKPIGIEAQICETRTLDLYFNHTNASTYLTDDLYFFVKLPSQMASLGTPNLVLGTEGVDWVIKSSAGVAQSGFSTPTIVVNGNTLQLKLTKVAHGLTSAFIEFLTQSKNIISKEL